MKDADINHLKWIYNRMLLHYGENENFDYMIQFKKIIDSCANEAHIRQAFEAGEDHVTYNGRPGYQDAPDFGEWYKKWKI